MIGVCYFDSVEVFPPNMSGSYRLFETGIGVLLDFIVKLKAMVCCSRVCIP